MTPIMDRYGELAGHDVVLSRAGFSREATASRQSAPAAALPRWLVVLGQSLRAGLVSLSPGWRVPGTPSR